MDEISDVIELDGNIIYVPKYILNKHKIEIINFVAYEKFHIYDYDTKKYELKEKRLNQSEFRKYLIERDKCCIITTYNADMCDACHIIPHNECDNDNKYDINNGFLLEAGLHKLFDKYLWSINPDTKLIKVSTKIINDDSYRMINNYNGIYVNLTDNVIINLKNHYDNFKIKNADILLNI
jgi:hypothetical protein